jgi:hypothetical protein
MTVARSHRQEKSSPYFELLESFKLKGCPVCALLAKTVQGYLANLLYENVNDAGVRLHLRQSLGFCRDHASTLMKNGDPLGIAIIYLDILQNVHHELSKENSESLSLRLECPTCTYRRQFERTYLEVLADYLHDKELERALDDSEGLCLDHLRQLVDHVQDDSAKNNLLSIHERGLDTTRKNLSEFVRKQGVRFRNEIVSPAEEAACQRAIDFLVGKSN